MCSLTIDSLGVICVSEEVLGMDFAFRVKLKLVYIDWWLTDLLFSDGRMTAG